MNRLDEIKARAAAIIPGPWRWMGNTATDQVYLATTHGGQTTILSPDVRRTEYVHHHEYVETYTLEQARENVATWCGQHEDGEDDADECVCHGLREFLAGRLDAEEAHRDYTRPGAVYPVLTRGVQVHADLRLPVAGHRMTSYREMVRYEVLGRSLGARWGEYRTKAEWTEEAGRVTLAEGRTGDRPAKTVDEALYREDFCGLDHPEATFIEHAAEDIPWLLAEVARLEAENERLQEQVHEMTL